MVGLRGRNERRAGRALAGLYEEHGGAVFAFALHLCGSREDAEDVVQTAYLHAFRALSAGERLVNPRAWLMVVVRRQVYNLWRARRETALAVVAEAAVEASDGEALAELRRVRMVLFSLPEAQHQAFVLRHWSGLSNREIAEVLETSESAVETLLVRARGAILAPGEGEEGACAGVRDRLAQGGTASQLELAHIGRCKGCSRAQARLARFTAAAAVVALAPRVHVAQALAAAVPGFKTGGGVAAGLAAGKASAAKLAVAGVLSAGTIVVTAPVAVHALHQRFHHAAPLQVHRQAAAATDWRAVPETHETLVAALAAAAPHALGGARQRHDSSHASDTGHRFRSSDGTQSQSDGAGQPRDGGGQSGDGGGQSGDGGGQSEGAGQSGDGGSGGTQDSSSGDGSASAGDSTSSGDAQGTGSSQHGGGDQSSPSDSSSSDGNGQ